MQIDNNPDMILAMEEHYKGNQKRYHELEDKFMDELRAWRVDRTNDHCNCTNAECKHHGHCSNCVAIHRAHGDHLPYCMQDMLNKRIDELLHLTESER